MTHHFEDAGTPEAASSQLYRWTCPVCGESRTRLVADGENLQHVTNDLQSHVRTIEGGGHGPAGSYPDGVDSGSLRHYVERSGW